MSEMVLPQQWPSRVYWIAFIWCFLFINASEVFRYFVFVMPMMREALPTLTNVAPMDLGVFAVWGVWDTILVFAVTGFVWMFFDRYGESWRKAVLAGSLIWCAIFVILWLGLYNMNLAPIKVVLVALSLSWLELVIAALIVLKVRRKHI